MEDTWDDSPQTSGDMDVWSNPTKRKLTEAETFRKLKELDDEYIELYLRTKKINKIKKTSK